jgi:hypothetical protein
MSEYIATECRGCQGTGSTFDPTNADSAAGTVDPSGIVQCSSCRGNGSIERLPEPAGMVREREMLEAQRATQEVGEMPDWMCG